MVRKWISALVAYLNTRAEIKFQKKREYLKEKNRKSIQQYNQKRNDFINAFTYLRTVYSFAGLQIYNSTGVIASWFTAIRSGPGFPFSYFKCTFNPDLGAVNFSLVLDEELIRDNVDSQGDAFWYNNEISVADMDAIIALANKTFLDKIIEEWLAKEEK